MAYQMLEMQKELPILSTKTETLEESSGVNGNQLDENFFQENSNVPKKIRVKKAKKAKTPYSTTKIKARNYLTNLP